MVASLKFSPSDVAIEVYLVLRPTQIMPFTDWFQNLKPKKQSTCISDLRSA